MTHNNDDPAPVDESVSYLKSQVNNWKICATGLQRERDIAQAEIERLKIVVKGGKIFALLATKNRLQLEATIAQLTAALDIAAKQFRFYEANHRAKPDHTKADTNATFAAKMEAAVRDAKEKK